MRSGRAAAPTLPWPCSVVAVAALLWLGLAPPGRAAGLPLTDAHSQIPDAAMAGDVLRWMDAAGVARAILSYRAGGEAELIDLARRYPRRVVPAIKIKGPAWEDGGPAFEAEVRRQLATGAFRAFGEALVYHAAKGRRAPRIVVPRTAPQLRFILAEARRRGWPVIIHIELAAAHDPSLLPALEALLSANPDMAFPLIHMGQLDAAAAAGLIARHPNVYFMTSHANPITARSGQPWTEMFAGAALEPEWHRLLQAHPDRFILAFDNVWPENWGPTYVRQVALWRRALATLPDAAAQLIAHGNAERLWHLPPG